MEKVGLEGVFETAGFTRGLAIFKGGIDQASGAARLGAAEMSTMGTTGAAVFSGLATAAAAAAAGIVIAIAGIVTAIAGIGFAAGKVAVSVESAWASVLKTTDGLEDEFGNLTELGQRLRDGFRELAQAVPVDLEDLMNIGALAAQLGIAEDQLVSFTEVMVGLGEATNLTSEQAAQAIAQIMNIFNVAAEDMAENASRFGSAIVELGNNFATTEADIMNFAQRIAGAGQIANMTQADILGIGAAMASVGIEAEAGGTAVQKVILSIQEAVSTGSAKLEEFARVAGMSASEFAAAWEEDAAGAFTAFVEGLGKAGDDAIQILADLGLEDQRLIRSFLSLAGAGDLLARAITASNDAWAANTALAAEAERRYATTAAQFHILKNVLRDIALIIGDALLPMINDLVTSGIELAQEWGPKLAAAIIPVYEALQRFFSTLMEGEFGTELLPRIADALANLLGMGAGADFSWVDVLAEGINRLSGALAILMDGDPLGFLQELELPPDVIALFASFREFGNTISDLFAKLSTSETAQENLSKINEVLSVLGDVLSDVGSKIVAFVTDNLDKFTAWLEDNESLIEDFSKVMGRFSRGVANAFKFLISNIPDIAGIIGTLLGGVVTLLLNLATLVMQIATGDWSGAWETIKKIPMDVLNTLGDMFTGLAEMVTGWFGTTWGDVVSQWEDNWNMLTEIVSKVWEIVTESVSEFFSGIGDSISGWFEGLKTAWEEGWNSLGEKLSSIWEGIKAKIQELVTGLFEWLKLDQDETVKQLGEIWNLFKEVIGLVWDAILTKITETATQIATFIQEKLNEISTFWNEQWQSVSTFVGEIWDQISAKISEITTSIAEKITEFLTKAAEEFNTKWSQIKETVTTIMGDILTVVGEKMAEVVSKIGDKIQEAVDKVKGFSTKFVEAGRALIQGLIDGAGELAGAFIQKMINIARAALQAIKDEFGQASPSRVMKEISENNIKGLIEGIEENATWATEQIAGAFRDMFGPAIQVASQVMGAGGGTQIYNQTTNYNVEANYQRIQSPARILDDLVMHSLLGK